MSEATEAASQLESPMQTTAWVPTQPEGHGLAEQSHWRGSGAVFLPRGAEMEGGFRPFCSRGLRKPFMVACTSTHSLLLL